MMGKWGLGWAGSSGDPNRQGFDHYLGVLCQRVAHNHYPTHLWRDGEKMLLDNAYFKAHQKLPAGADPDDPASYAGFTGERLLDGPVDGGRPGVRPRARGPSRSSSTCPYLVPHVALQVPADSLAEYAGAFEETPYVGDQGYLPHRTPRAAYAAMITRMDRDIGRIVDLVDELGLAERTLIVFSSDNGPDLRRRRGPRVLREQRALPRPQGAALRGRHPRADDRALARYGRAGCDHGSDPPRSRTSCRPSSRPRAARSPDGDRRHLLPARRCAVTSPAQSDGTRSSTGSTPDAGRPCARDAGRPSARGRSTPLELYDLDADPGETTDVAIEHLDIMRRMKTYMESERTPSEHFPLVRDK